MPCDSIVTQSVALAKAMPELVEEAMKSLGSKIFQQSKISIRARASDWTYVNWTAGTGLTVDGRNKANNQQHITALTKAYSVKAVSWAAQRAGWQVQQTAADKLTDLILGPVEKPKEEAAA